MSNENRAIKDDIKAILGQISSNHEDVLYNNPFSSTNHYGFYKSSESSSGAEIAVGTMTLIGDDEASISRRAHDIVDETKQRIKHQDRDDTFEVESEWGVKDAHNSDYKIVVMVRPTEEI